MARAVRDAAPSDRDGVGIEHRVSPASGMDPVTLALGVLLLALVVGLWWSFRPSLGAGPAPRASSEPDSGIRSDVVSDTRAAAADLQPLPGSAVPPAHPATAESVADALATRQAAAAASNDLASYVKPGDVEPTASELIHALRQSGDHGGIAAFNPPGTSPPMAGIAVPSDYVLPPGYVRHHQVSDDGVPIEPILMFAPDMVLRDGNGQPVAMPENRVVPPEWAPPGLPIRQVELPPPEE